MNKNLKWWIFRVVHLLLLMLVGSALLWASSVNEYMILLVLCFVFMILGLIDTEYLDKLPEGKNEH